MSSTQNKGSSQNQSKKNAWLKRLAEHSDNMDAYFTIMGKEVEPATKDMAFKAMLMEFFRFFECSQERQHSGCDPVVVGIAKNIRNLIAHPKEDYEQHIIATVLTLITKNMGQTK